MARCRRNLRAWIAVVMLCGVVQGARSQVVAVPFPSPLDAGRDVKALVHTPLPEEYVWTAGDVTAKRPDRSKFPWRSPQLRTDWHQFRRTFEVKAVPAKATLYVAGPREAEVYLNGTELAHFSSNVDAPIGFRVFHANAAKLLRAGKNVLAIRAVRGRGVVSDATMATLQVAYGEVLAAKIVPAALGIDAPAIVMSDGSWKSRVETVAGDAWYAVGFDDSGWPQVMSLGGVESNRDFMQWSADAGMYGWPGYMGMTAPLGTYEVRPVAVTHVFAGSGKLLNIGALSGGAGAFSVEEPSQVEMRSDAESPTLLLDFGREVSGRLLVESGSDNDALLSIAYGESELEAMATGLTPGQRGGNYLGTNLLDVGAHATARGPKSAFRYVRVGFLHGSGAMKLRAEGIAYPVSYGGSFESSDATLNRIWETAAYTAHLCMQDDLWDAPKRDRGRWAGDIDVEGRTISDVFGDHALLERTLTALVPAEGKQVNGIPGYSALWITSLANLYSHSGDIEFLRRTQPALLRVLRTMDATLNGSGGFSGGKGAWMFVDWSPGMYGATPAAQLGTKLQYLRGYREAVVLLDALGDAEESARVGAVAERLQKSIEGELSGSPQASWQIDALLVHDGLIDPQQAWETVLSKVKQDVPSDQQITPYFNATVLDAMAQTGHGLEAMAWMRTYWGGMLAEGATSFWESYDLRWPKDNPHLSLQADGTSGYFVSMAHGWSSGPAAWLSENVLGVRDARDGFRTVTIAPRLMGLAWAKGAVPTPQGAIAVSERKVERGEVIEVEIPRQVQEATISVDASNVADVLLDGKTVEGAIQVRGAVQFVLRSAGHYEIAVKGR